MGTSGFAVRFVDVVLILLFGFVSISDVKQSHINLPQSAETPPTPVDKEEIIFVGVLSDGTFLIEDETRAVPGIRELRLHLRHTQERYGDTPLKVRLRCSFDTPIRYAMQAAQVCDQLGIPKSLDVRLKPEG